MVNHEEGKEVKDKDETVQKGKTKRYDKKRIQDCKELLSLASEKHFWNVNDSIMSTLFYDIQFPVIPHIIIHFIDKPALKIFVSINKMMRKINKIFYINFAKSSWKNLSQELTKLIN